MDARKSEDHKLNSFVYILSILDVHLIEQHNSIVRRGAIAQRSDATGESLSVSIPMYSVYSDGVGGEPPAKGPGRREGGVAKGAEVIS
jgi:hypothetical protein